MAFPRGWESSIELNAVLSEVNDEFDLSRHEEDCPTEVKERIAAEVRKSPQLEYLADDLLECESIAEFNRMLNCVFDEADAERVWCGFPKTHSERHRKVKAT